MVALTLHLPPARDAVGTDRSSAVLDRHRVDGNDLLTPRTRADAKLDEPTPPDIPARLITLQQRPVDVRSIVTGLISARGWQDTVAVDVGPLTLTTDPRRIERILANLVENAVEHSGRDVSVRSSTDGVHGCIEVADGGPGIPPDRLPLIFERFYKADSARASAGSGLGLAIALENARLLGGDITVSSDVRRGSVFRLTVPLGPGDTVSER